MRGSILPGFHSSEISTKTAETNRSRDASLGNRVATRVRRFSSRLSRSTTFEVLNLRRKRSSKAKAVRPSGMFSSIHFANPGAVSACAFTTCFKSRSASSLLGAWKMERIVLATWIFMSLRGT